MSSLEVESETIHTAFRVSGNNWFNYVYVNVEEFDDDTAVFAEAATKGVEKFQLGEYSRVDYENDKVGFGSQIKVEDESLGVSKGIRSDIILANAGLHAEAAKLKKLIDKRKQS